LVLSVIFFVGDRVVAEESLSATSLPDLVKTKDPSAPETGVRNAPNGLEPGNLAAFGAWELIEDKQFAKALKASADKPVLVFKHSTQCPISGAAYKRMAKYLDEAGDDAPPFYFVKVIEQRPVSQGIAKKLDVKHESPQLILLKGEKALWSTSHHAITSEALTKALDKASAEKK
jgi:bacillithiol system protein YtxJ